MHVTRIEHECCGTRTERDSTAANDRACRRWMAEQAEEDVATTARPRSVLFQDEALSVILIDVPASIEEAQVSLAKAGAGLTLPKRLVSSQPLDHPFATPEPKDVKGGLADSVSDLMTAAAAARALDLLRQQHSGPHCLPRTAHPVRGVEEATVDQSGESVKRSRKIVPALTGAPTSPEEACVAETRREDGAAFIPEYSIFLQGTIASERDRFLAKAPKFDLIVLDPPWPNRSARRKKGNYKVADSLDSIRTTLSLIPVGDHLAADGLVAMWITNKPGVVRLLTGSGGLFTQWGLEQVDEWTWLKITTAGEPIVDMASTWRKPWERILIARKRGSLRSVPGRGKVLVSVPDLHSRKPNLRGVFQDVFSSEYMGLEVFARNLTAGWWSWGNEVLAFQQPEHWFHDSSVE